jgi:hypothetical protein
MVNMGARTIVQEGCDRDWLVEMVESGDWNCAHGDHEALAMVARSLSMAVAGRLALDLVAIARLALVDFAEARRRWVRLSYHLRTVLGRRA